MRHGCGSQFACLHSFHYFLTRIMRQGRTPRRVVHVGLVHCDLLPSNTWNKELFLNDWALIQAKHPPDQHHKQVSPDELELTQNMNPQRLNVKYARVCAILPKDYYALKLSESKLVTCRGSGYSGFRYHFEAVIRVISNVIICWCTGTIPNSH